MVTPTRYIYDQDEGDCERIHNNDCFNKNKWMNLIFYPTWSTLCENQKLYNHLDKIEEKLHYAALWKSGLQNNIIFVDPDQNIGEKGTLDLFFQIHEPPNFFEEM